MEPYDIQEVVDWVRDRLISMQRERNIELKLEERDYRLDDDWLLLTVLPAKPGIRASEYAEAMAEIEKALHEEKNIDHVLLVPAINE